MFNILLQENHSESNRVDKDITAIQTLSGTLREETSILTPKFLCETALFPSNANYMTIESFGRKYFITDIKSVRTGLYEISGRVDVLSSYADQIRECKAILRRSENDWNTYIDDGTFRTYQVPQIVQKYFPSGFSGTPTHILTTI